VLIMITDVMLFVESKTQLQSKMKFRIESQLLECACVRMYRKLGLFVHCRAESKRYSCVYCPLIKCKLLILLLKQSN